MALPEVRPCRPFLRPRGTGGRRALVAGKGAKAQKIGLKRQARARVWLQIVGASYEIAVGVTAAATQGVRGRLSRKPAARPCRPLLRPPPRERSGRQTALARDCKPQMALDCRRVDAHVVH